MSIDRPAPGGGMRVLGLVGWSGSGKTTLIEATLPLLARDGRRVATIKHAHQGFDLDRPGKDSFRHRAAGAAEVLVASERRWALLHEAAPDEEFSLPALLARLGPADLVLVEGFKSYPFPKIEVHRPGLGKPPIWPGDPGILAVASDAALSLSGPALLPLNDPAAIAAWIGSEILDRSWTRSLERQGGQAHNG